MEASTRRSTKNQTNARARTTETRNERRSNRSNRGNTYAHDDHHEHVILRLRLHAHVQRLPQRLEMVPLARLDRRQRVHEVTSLVGEKREFPALLHHLHRSSGHCSSARTRCARASVDRNPRERTNGQMKRCCVDLAFDPIHPSRARTRTARKATTSSGHDSSSFVSFVSSPRALGRVGVDEVSSSRAVDARARVKSHHVAI